MIIETKYRDIPFEEARKCASKESFAWTNAVEARQYWDQWRGKTIRIQTPPLPPQTQFHICGGPHYDTIGESMGLCVCPHMAEIGD